MTSSNSVDQASFDNETLNRVERLLLRYPDLSEAERNDVADFLRNGTILEVGLLSMNQAAWRNAEEFRASYPARFATTDREYVGLASVIAGIILVLALFWAIAF